MAGRFINPLPQFSDSTPTMYAGCKLYFYATGTSTKLNTYTTKALAVANTNPIILDSAGRIPGDIFLQDLEYKVVLAPSTDSDPPSSPIWTADPVSHRDSSLVAKTLTGSGAPTGVVAGTAGSASILPDFYWDYTNLILYVCTTTGTAATAGWTAINSGAATPSVPPPQGRLTLRITEPVLVTDVISTTLVHYIPCVGNLIPIYNGVSMTPTEFSNLTLILVAGHTANSIYDVFVFSNSGVLTLVTGPAWTTATAGSGARGTDAGTTQLTRVKGLLVNAVSMTARNGATTYTVGASLGTYVGSIAMDGTNGQVSCTVVVGQSRKWGVWNAFNRSPIRLQVTDSNTAWDYRTATIRPARGDVTNKATVFTGLAEEPFNINYSANVAITLDAGGVASGNARIGVGWNSTTTIVGRAGQASASSVANGSFGFAPTASYQNAPALGIQNVTANELGPTGAVTCSFGGTELGMRLVAEYLG